MKSVNNKMPQPLGIKSIIEQNAPDKLIAKIKGRWYLENIIEKAIFIVGAFAILYAILRLIGMIF